MTEQKRTSTATYEDAIALIADKLYLRRESEREMVSRINKGQDVFADQLRECSDRYLTQAMAMAEAVSVLYATYYDEVVDRAYEVMHELYDAE